MKKLKKYIDKILIVLGSSLVAYGIYNIHSRCNIAEGGELGIELLIYNLLNISPAIVSLTIDITSYTIGCGIVINNQGACGGDDAMALIIARTLRIPVSISYFLLDVLVIVTSLLYIENDKIIYSFLTAMISSILIGYISKMSKSNKFKNKLDLQKR